MQPWLLPHWPYEYAIALVERERRALSAAMARLRSMVLAGHGQIIRMPRLELARNAPRVFEADAARLAMQALAGQSDGT